MPRYSKYIIVNFVDRILGMVPLTCAPPYTEVKSSGTTIISPNYPKNYGDGKICQISIKFPLEQRVLITFNAFNVGYYHCAFDWHHYLEVIDGDSSNSRPLGPRLCGSNSPKRILSTSNTITLILNAGFATYSRFDFGFKLKVFGVGKLIIKYFYTRTNIALILV